MLDRVDRGALTLNEALIMSYRQLSTSFVFVVIFCIFFILVPSLIGRLIMQGNLVPQYLKDQVKETFLSTLNHKINIVAASKFIGHPSMEEAALFEDIMDRADLDKGEYLGDNDGRDIVQIFYLRFKTVCELLLGYSVYVSVGVTSYCTLCLMFFGTVKYRVPVVDILRNQAIIAFNFLNMVIKLKVFAAIYGVLVPGFLSLLIYKPLYKRLPLDVQMEIDTFDFARVRIALYTTIVFVYAFLLFASRSLLPLSSSSTLLVTVSFIPSSTRSHTPALSLSHTHTRTHTHKHTHTHIYIYIYIHTYVH